MYQANNSVQGDLNKPPTHTHIMHSPSHISPSERDGHVGTFTYLVTTDTKRLPCRRNAESLLSVSLQGVDCVLTGALPLLPSLCSM